MRLLITVLMVLAPLVLSAPATKRAPGDESREDDLCSHPLDSTLCETSKHNSPVVWRKTGFESAAASALNDMRVISNNRFDEVRTPASITTTSHTPPRPTTTSITTRKSTLDGYVDRVPSNPLIYTQSTTTPRPVTTTTRTTFAPTYLPPLFFHRYIIPSPLPRLVPRSIPTTDPPPIITEPPPIITEPPPIITEPPPITTDPPPIITDPPPIITDPPPIITDSPLIITDPPSIITDPPPTITDPPPTITDPPPTITETPKPKPHYIRRHGGGSHGFLRFRNGYRYHTSYTSRRITTTDPPPTNTDLPPTITEPAPTTTDPPPPTTTDLPPTIREPPPTITAPLQYYSTPSPTHYIPSSSNTRSPFVPFVWGQKRPTMPGTSTQTPEHFPHTPSITPTDPSTTTSDTPTTIPHDPGYVRCVFGVSSTGECIEPPPGTRLSPFLRAEPLPPQLAALHFPLVTKDTSRPTTSDTPTITTQDPTDPCISSLDQCTTPEPSFLEVPLFRDSSLPLASLTNDTPKPTTSDKPAPTMQTTVFYKPEPTTKATILPAATSLHLPQITNNLVSPTTPTSTRLYPPQPQPTRPATNRSPFHDACSTISTDEDNNPSRAGAVLCVLNIANYYDQVHYHQTIHNHYNV